MKDKGTLVDTNYLKSIRVLRGLSAKKVAALVGMDYNSFLHKENGMVAFTDSEKIRLAEKYGMTMTEFNQGFYSGKIPIG